MNRWGFTQSDLTEFLRSVSLRLADVEYEIAENKRSRLEPERKKLKHLVGMLKRLVKERELAK